LVGQQLREVIKRVEREASDVVVVTLSLIKWTYASYVSDWKLIPARANGNKMKAPRQLSFQQESLPPVIEIQVILALQINPRGPS
jgi:hypothetical protein